MENNKPQIALVRNKNTNVIYKWEGGTTFTNLNSGVTQELTKEQASQHLKIPLALNRLVNDYPLVYDLIVQLELGCDSSVTEK